MNFIQIAVLVILVLAHIEFVAAIISGHLSGAAFGKIKDRAYHFDLCVALGVLIYAATEIFNPLTQG